MTDDYTPCGLGPCAAPAGHDGTCAQASGWDKFTDDAKDASYEAGFAAGRAAALAEQGEVEWEWMTVDEAGRTFSTREPDTALRWRDRGYQVLVRRAKQVIPAGEWVPVNENGETP